MTYFHHIRSEIQPLLPEKIAHILEVGAGAGRTLRWLKTIYPKASTTGVELNTVLADELKINADVAIIGNIDECIEKLKTYDLILLLDVLEHLVDSTETLKRLSRLLVPGGNVIVSVPNIAHISVSAPLLLCRRFSYQEAGILDHTHLRFFVEDTAIKLLNDAGLVVDAGLISGLQRRKYKMLNWVSFGLLRHHLVQQYIMRGQLVDKVEAQPKIHWAKAK